MTQIKQIINVMTGEITEVELTADELAAKKLANDQYAKRVVEAEAKIAARASALAKLAALGLSADEIAAL